MKKALFAVIIVLFLAGPAMAGFTSTNLVVSATAIASCTIDTPPLTFGNFSGSEVVGQTSIEVNCPPSVPYSVNISAAGVIGGKHWLSDGFGNTLSYDLYQPDNTTLWGDPSLTYGTPLSGQTGSGSIQYLTVYGRIPAQIFVPGSFIDSTVVTVEF